MSDKFWAVWRETGGAAPSKRHGTKQEAITEAGRLSRQTGDRYFVLEVVDRSDPNAEGLAQLFGLATRVNERWEPVALTGEIVFYAGDFEFSAYFVGGKLKHLETLQAPNLK